MKHSISSVQIRLNNLIDRLTDQAIWEDVCTYDMAPPVIVGYKTRKCKKIEARINRLISKYSLELVL